MKKPAASPLSFPVPDKDVPDYCSTTPEIHICCCEKCCQSDLDFGTTLISGVGVAGGCRGERSGQGVSVGGRGSG